MPRTNWSTLPPAYFLQAANGLVPMILAERDNIEQRRELPSYLVEEIRDAGLFSLWLPKVLVPRIVKSRNTVSCAFGERHSSSRQKVEPVHYSWQ